MATFVLVHGAWAGGIIWRPIARALRSASHEVYTPTLTGIGERKHLLNRGVDLGTHIQDVLGVLDYEDLSDIVLVGHSYGGMVVTAVADAVPNKIASLVYLDAFVPQDGQSLFSMVPTDKRAQPLAAPGEDWLTAPLPAEAFGNPSQQVRDFIARKGMPQPVACFSQPVRLTGGIEHIRRKTYIYCNDPQPSVFTPLYERLNNRPGWILRTLHCTHFPQIDMPEDLTALLKAAA
jgi:pimeloyl-ACP methyl ester carboxylesterase